MLSVALEVDSDEADSDDGTRADLTSKSLIVAEHPKPAISPANSLPDLDNWADDAASFSPDGAAGSLRRAVSSQLKEIADTFRSEPNMSRDRQVNSTFSVPRNAARRNSVYDTGRMFPKLVSGALSSPISRVTSVPAFNEKYPGVRPTSAQTARRSLHHDPARNVYTASTDQQSSGLEDTPSPLLSDPMSIPSPTRNCGYPKMTASPERPMRLGLSPRESPPLPSPRGLPPLPGSRSLPGSALSTAAWLAEQERREDTASPSKSVD